MNALDKIAPYPKAERDVSAEAMARSFAAYAYVNHRLVLEHPDSGEQAKATTLAVTLYALAFLLYELEEAVGTKAADRVARRLWEDQQSPHVLGPSLHELLAVEYEIDHAALDKVADDIIAKAGTGGAA